MHGCARCAQRAALSDRASGRHRFRTKRSATMTSASTSGNERSTLGTAGIAWSAPSPRQDGILAGPWGTVERQSRHRSRRVSGTPDAPGSATPPAGLTRHAVKSPLDPHKAAANFAAQKTTESCLTVCTRLLSYRILVCSSHGRCFHQLFQERSRTRAAYVGHRLLRWDQPRCHLSSVPASGLPSPGRHIPHNPPLSAPKLLRRHMKRPATSAALHFWAGQAGRSGRVVQASPRSASLYSQKAQWSW